MPEPSQDDLPPLGSTAPPRGSRAGRPWYGSTPLAAAVALAVGLLVGIPIGQAIDSQATDRPAADSSRSDLDDTVPPTTTTVPALPQDCVEMISSAQQALVLLEEGLQSLGDLQLGEVEEVLADLERLREGFARRAQDCLENPGIADDGQ